MATIAEICLPPHLRSEPEFSKFFRANIVALCPNETTIETKTEVVSHLQESILKKINIYCCCPICRQSLQINPDKIRFSDIIL